MINCVYYYELIAAFEGLNKKNTRFSPLSFLLFLKLKTWLSGKRWKNGCGVNGYFERVKFYIAENSILAKREIKIFFLNFLCFLLLGQIKRLFIFFSCFSVERLYFQLLSFGHPTLDPIVVKSDGAITLKKEKHAYNILANIFHDHA